MNECFEYRSLIDQETMRSLQRRQDGPSLVRLALHLLIFAGCIGLVAIAAPYPWAAAMSAVLLGAVWATLFAPFHECTHLTAFRSRWLNVLGTWLTGIPVGMAPAVYRTSHFEHHRHTHDPQKDPEISFAPSQLAIWPANVLGWLVMISGVGGMFFKALSLVGFSVLPYRTWDRILPWVPPLARRSRLAWESRIVGLCWLAFVTAAIVGVPGFRWMMLALVVCHAFQTAWLTTEHTGLPQEGTILARTRTVITWPVVRWFLWNMNYHAEHHAWPAIPWHELHVLHQRVGEHVEHQSPGYVRLHYNVLRRGRA